MLELFERYGARGSGVLLRRADRLLRACDARRACARCPDGDYEFTDYIDGLGEDPEPIVFQVKVTITATSCRSTGPGRPTRSRPASTRRSRSRRRRPTSWRDCSSGRELPNSEGYMRPLHTFAPEGSILNPREPAACATRGITGMRAVDTLLGALAARRCRTGCRRAAAATTTGRPSAASRGWQAVRARRVGDGRVGRPPDSRRYVGRTAPGRQPAEPARRDGRGQAPDRDHGVLDPKDAAGAGRWRGGNGLVREYRLRAEEAVLTIRTARRTALPYGLHGGKPGTPAYNILNPGADQRILPTLPMEAVRAQTRRRAADRACGCRRMG